MIEPLPGTRERLKKILRDNGYAVVTAGSAIEGQARFLKAVPDVVLLDLRLPDSDGVAFLRTLIEHPDKPTVIALSPEVSIPLAVEAVRAGAFEFLIVPVEDKLLLEAVKRALSVHRLRNAPSLGAVMESGHFLFGSSRQIREVEKQVRSLAGSAARVFITGEISTGKSLCARVIHEHSGRRGQFVTVNCVSDSTDALEAELFGRPPGKDGTGGSSGAILAANGGTLFLDNVCELDPKLQARLLRFVENSAITLPGTSTPRSVDVRVICATTRDPRREIRAGRFREDLFYRLNVISIHMPPLRQRGNDAVEIAEALLQEFGAAEKRRFKRLSPEVANLFSHFPWPGNLRQLMNVMQHIVVLHDAEAVTRDMLPGDLLASDPHGPDGSGPDLNQLLQGKTLAEVERFVIEATIARTKGSVTRAAQILGVSPSTLYRRLDAWKKD